MFPREVGLFSRDSEPAEFPDGDAADGEASASMIIAMFVGLGVAVYGGYALVRWALALG